MGVFDDFDNIDLNKPPQDFTPAEVDLILWQLKSQTSHNKDLLEKVKTLQAEKDFLAKRKEVELAKPLKKKIKFDDLAKKLFQIYAAENSLVEFGEASSPIINSSKATDLAKKVAELVVLATTYLDRHSVDANGRRILFNQLKEEKF